MNSVLIVGIIVLVLIAISVVLTHFLKVEIDKNKKLQEDLKGLERDLASVRGLYEKLQQSSKDKEDLHEEVHASDSLTDSANKLRDKKPKRSNKG